MTTLQLKVVVSVAELGSISAAAKELGISQPNASNSTRALEEEIGFDVFLRTSTGATVTPKGASFLKYARQILNANEKIMDLRYAEEVYRLHLGTVNYYTAAEPFFTLCAEHRNDAKADLLYFSVSVTEGLQSLVNRNLDVLAIPFMKHQAAGLIRECKAAGIEMTSIQEIPSVIMMRKGHPAALDGRCRNITQGCDAMKDFPYVGIRNLTKDPVSTGYNDSDFIQCSYKMFADDTNVRLRMIEATNGFGFGIQSSYRMMDQFGLVSFPVPGVSLELCCLTRHGEADRREIRDYLALLKKEMRLLRG